MIDTKRLEPLVDQMKKILTKDQSLLIMVYDRETSENAALATSCIVCMRDALSHYIESTGIVHISEAN